VRRLAEPSDGEPDEKIDCYYRVYSPAVWSLCHRLTEDRHVAEDLTQETFARALVSLRSQPSFHQYPLSWLLTIARNLCLDRIRRRHLAPVVAKTDSRQALDLLKRAADEVDDETFDSVLKIQRGKRIRDQLVAALAMLKPAERRIFLLHEDAGWDYETIAHADGVTVDAVRNAAYRARTHLRRMLSRELLIPVFAGWARIRAWAQRQMQRSGGMADLEIACRLVTATALTLGVFSVQPFAASGMDQSRSVGTTIASAGSVASGALRSNATAGVVPNAPARAPERNGPISVEISQGKRKPYAARPEDANVHVVVQPSGGPVVLDHETWTQCSGTPVASLPPGAPARTSC
jgi:RNA polymerase sigma-70 factor (ECF subfamily)